MFHYKSFLYELMDPPKNLITLPANPDISPLGSAAAAAKPFNATRPGCLVSRHESRVLSHRTQQ